ncbi:MAG TPA: aminotransferase class V-fold PLP-dependent enzyme, partial [Candidatus Aminicenantes bacterium]|nr:aminotransferase class V-fold PLP-dependent enzyme [Candidatus Aminicenantes bacterium]
KAQGALTLLDASQTAGMLPLDEVLPAADLVAFPGHKYLLGPPGTGVLAIREGVELDSVFTGGTGGQSEAPTMPDGLPARLEVGTPNPVSFAGLSASLGWLRGNAEDPTRIPGLADSLTEALQRCGARVVAVSGPRTGVVSFTLPGWTVRDAGMALERGQGVVCRAGLHCAPLIHAGLGTRPEGTVRFSLSRFTTPDELDRAVWAVDRMLHGAR